jgi:hypothetical protein
MLRILFSGGIVTCTNLSIEGLCSVFQLFTEEQFVWETMTGTGQPFEGAVEHRGAVRGPEMEGKIVLRQFQRDF